MAIISELDEVLDAVAQLPVEDQQSLVDIVSRRIRENRRRECIADVLEGEREFAAGKLRPMSVEDIMKEVDS
jgi:hypothetical protein